MLCLLSIYSPKLLCTHSSEVTIASQLAATEIIFISYSSWHSLIAVSGAVLWYKVTFLSGSSSSVTLSVGEFHTVFCGSPTTPTSIGWYNPQGQLVSRNNRDEVYQAGSSDNKTAYLIFESFRQSQGGKYECRVAVPGKKSNLSVCIGEWYTLDEPPIVSLPCQLMCPTIIIIILYKCFWS